MQHARADVRSSGATFHLIAALLAWAGALSVPGCPALAQDTLSSEVEKVGEAPKQQADETAADGARAGDDTPGESAEKPKKVDLLVAPVPLSNPASGTGLAVGAIGFYNPNGEPRQWISGVGLIYTSRGTTGIGAYHSMSFGQDLWRLTGLISYAEAHRHYYGIGEEAGNRGDILDLVSDEFTFQVELLRRVIPHGYAGVRYRLFDTDGSPQQPSTPTLPAPPDSQLNSTQSAFGPSLAYDTRDSSLQPRRGAYITSVWLFGVRALGDSFAHNRLKMSAAGYFPLGTRTVLAVRGSLCSAGGEVPYYDLCLFGSTNDLRGYPSGRYRDRASWATQAELRQHVFNRWGAVAFFGVGGIAPSFGEIFTNGNVLPAGGVGVRYQPFRKNDVQLRLDFAAGKDEHAVYLGIGEAF
jgi:outer membrane protein assembly factor BamA